MKKRVKDIVDIDVLFDTKLKTIKGAGLSAFFQILFHNVKNL